MLAVSIIVLRFSTSMGYVFVSVSIIGVVMSIFWPVILSAIGKESPKGKESKKVAQFSVSWSSGKSVGFFLSGYCFSYLGAGNSISMILALSGLLLVLYPYMSPEDAVNCSAMELEQRALLNTSRDGGEPSSSPPPPPSSSIELTGPDEIPTTRSTSPAPQLSSFIEIEGKTIPRDPLMSFNNSLNLPLAWMFNFFLYGIANTISSLYVKVIMHYGIEIEGVINTDSFLGVWNCCFYVVQTICFFVGSRHVWIWEYNRKAMYIAEVIQCIGLFCLGTVRNPYVLLVIGGAMGTGVGLADLCALTYSIRVSDTEKGKYTGINEAIVNAGSFFFPIVLGFLSDHNYVIPYIILSGVTLLCIIMQEAVYRLRFNRARKTFLEEPYSFLSSEQGLPSEDLAALSEAELAARITRVLGERSEDGNIAKKEEILESISDDSTDLTD